METSAISEKQIVSFEFKGKASEFFTIVIVNVVLTIITLGFYSPWAKVRTNKYLYGNTYLNDIPFMYTASPVKILKGRLLALCIFILYYMGTNFIPQAAFVFALAFVLVIPWVIVNSMRFKARYILYNNIPFVFKGSYIDAFKYYILYYLFIPFTLGLIIPFISYKQKNFIISNLQYGPKPIQYRGNSGPFYIAFFASFILGGILFSALIGLFLLVTQNASSGLLKDIESKIGLLNPEVFVIFGIYILFALAFTFITIFYKTFIINSVLSNTYISNSKLTCRLDYIHIFALYITNGLAIIASLGLAIPWAIIRYRKYIYSRIEIELTENFDEITHVDEGQISSIAEELGGFLDLDIGF